MVTTADFPQADRLEQVGRVVIAIDKENRTDEEIEAFIGLDSDGRQGRYYRRAAEVLGLVFLKQRNHAVLTPLGNEFASLSNPAARMEFLARRLVETTVFHEALRYIHQCNPTDNQFKQWFRSFYPGAKKTANRRFNTFISYPRDAGLLQPSAVNNRLQKYAGAVIKQSAPPSQGLTGRRLKELLSAPPTSSPQGSICFDVDAQKRERACQIHWQLVDAKSSFLDGRNLEPYDNPRIDLYANDQGDVILYEMKSVAPEGINLLSQIRKAVSQLYEYRYVYDVPRARLCIVTNYGIAKKDEWPLDYLAKDRAIAYEWTDDFVNFQCRKDAAAILAGFSP